MQMMMANAIQMASIFGPFLMIMGVWQLFYQENMLKALTSCKNNPAVFCTHGLINLLIGLTVLTQYGLWNWNLALLVTLFGWVQLIRGLMVFFLPQLLIKLFMKDKNWLRFKGVIPIVWGFGMCWLAFWMV